MRQRKHWRGNLARSKCWTNRSAGKSLLIVPPRLSEADMRERVSLFKDLPATFPEKDRYKKPSVVSSFVFHVVLLAVLLLIPLLVPQHIEEWKLTALLVS